MVPARFTERPMPRSANCHCFNSYSVISVSLYSLADKWSANNLHLHIFSRIISVNKFFPDKGHQLYKNKILDIEDVKTIMKGMGKDRFYA